MSASVSASLPSNPAGPPAAGVVGAVDPKYAHLPGIAFDQPDVYETADLPESEQADADAFQDASDSIETLHVSADEAFGKFKGKKLDSSGVDFSDRLRPAKDRKGYICWSGDLEVLNKELDETPMQKYTRLQLETRELMEQLQSAAEAEKTGSEAGSGDKAGTGNDLPLAVSRVTRLQEELSELKLEELLGSEAVRRLEDPQGAAHAKLMAHLKALQKGRQGTEAATSAEAKANVAGAGDAKVTYELMMKPETARMEEQERLAQLDRRLEAIEKALGATPDNMSALSVETNSKSVFGAISVLSSRTSLFDPGQLDHVEGRLAALQQKMNAVAERKQTIEDQEKQNRLDQLYDMVERSEAMSHVLPDVVDRLEALQGLHEQALQFSNALTQLDNVQQKLTASLDGNDALLKETRKKFAENVGGIQENMKAVESRLDKLGK